MYSKLFRSMYEGTLATKGPWQALVTFQQMLVLSDRFGVVDMTPEAISRITTIPQDIIETGIAELERPDPESRRDNDEGKRIVRLSDKRSWGWQIVNYEHYAKIRSAEERRDYHRQYMQEYRKRESVAQHATDAKTPKRPRVQYTEDFEQFWAAYPRHTAKAQAARAFAKADAPLEVMVQAIVNQRGSEQWRRGVIPHAATWLNQRRWEDEAQDYGVCKFCGVAATQIISGVPCCDTPRHMDQAKDWARNAR